MKWYNLVIVLILLTFANEMKSNHILGGHISYECLGGNDYQFTLSVYSDCFGQQPNPSPDNLIFFTPDGSCAGLNIIANLAVLSTTQEISELCDEELLDSSCIPGGFSPGTILTTYTVTQTLDPSCIWTASWAADDYNFFINTDFPIFDDAYFSATVDPTLGCNSTLDIDGTQQIPYGLVGELFSHQIEYTSTPGNTVTFSISTPQVENNQLSFDIPGFDPSTITVSTTGLVEFTPPTIGNYVTNITIEETDPMGNVVYTMTETMAFISRINIPGEPEFTDGGGILNTGGTSITSTEYEVCEGDSICITFETIHPDPFSIMEITSNVTTLFPGATLDSIACPLIVPGQNAICSEVCWLGQPTMNTSFSMYVIDNDCELPTGDTIDVQLTLTTGATLSVLNTDSVICEGTTVDVDLITGGIPDFVLDYSTELIGSGIIDTTTVDPFGLAPISLLPTDDTEYCIVRLTDSEGCSAPINALDSCFIITVNPELATTGLGNDTTICVGESVDLDLGLTGTAPFTVDFTVTNQVSGLTGDEQTVVLALGEAWTITPDSSSVFSITSITGGSPVNPCVLVSPDAITVDVNEFTTVSISTDSIACAGDLVSLNFEFENFIGPEFEITYTSQIGAGPPVSSTISNIPLLELTPDSLYSISAIPGGITENTTFELIEIIDDNNTCVTLSETIATVLLAPEVNVDFSIDGTICAGDSLLTTMTLTGDGPWVIDVNSPGSVIPDEITASITPFEYYALEDGVYTISAIEDTYGCPGTINGQVDVTLIELSQANIDGTSNICPGSEVEVPLTLISDAPLHFEILDPNNVLIEDSAGYFIGDSTFTASIPGIYTLQLVRNIDGCENDTITSTHNVLEVTTPMATLSGNGFICTDDSTQVFIDILNGTAPFDYTLQEITTLESTVFNQVTLSDSTFILAAGEYTLINFIDSNNCVGSLAQNITLLDSPLPIIDAGIDFSACANSVNILGTIDDPLLTYEWTSNNIAVLDTLTGAFPQITVLNSGIIDVIFEVYLEVNNGICANHDTLEITVPPQPLSDAGLDVSVCFGEPAVLSGMGMGTLSWLNNGNLDDYTIATPNVLNTQVTDTFILQIEDAFNPGCFGLDSVIVNVNPEINISLDYTSETCFGTCEGTITPTITGGTGAITEVWTNSIADVLDPLSLINLCADSYTVSITDDSGCTADSTLLITEIAEFYITDVLITDPICFGDETGIIEVLAVNADSITVNSTIQLLSPIFTDLPATDYDITVVNNIGCEADTTVTLNSNPELFINTNFDTLDLCDGDNVTFEATASGGVNDYNYFWIPNTGDFNTNSGMVNLTPTEDISVQVYATDDAGQCFSDTLDMLATFPPVISVTVNDDITICQGEQVILESVVSGGTGILSCFWDVPETGIINNCITTVMPTISTTYSVTVEDGCSIPVTASFDVNVNITPQPTFSVDTLNGCYPVTVNFSNTTDAALQGNCSWDFGDGSVPLPICTDVTYSYVNPGNYTPSITVTSDEGCTGTSSFNPTIIVYDYPTADFDWSPNPTNILEPEVQFINLTSGGTNYLWEAEGAFTATGTNPYFEFEPNSLDSYNICLQAENEFGCADTICKFLVIEGIVIVNVPNAFSPDGDNLNEVFMPSAVGIAAENYLFQIWSREGNLIFETTERGVAWDGSISNGDYYAGNAVYTWILEVQDSMSADIHTYKGHVTILR